MSLLSEFSASREQAQALRDSFLLYSKLQEVTEKNSDFSGIFFSISRGEIGFAVEKNEHTKISRISSSQKDGAKISRSVKKVAKIIGLTKAASAREYEEVSKEFGIEVDQLRHIITDLHTGLETIASNYKESLQDYLHLTVLFTSTVEDKKPNQDDILSKIEALGFNLPGEQKAVLCKYIQDSLDPLYKVLFDPEKNDEDVRKALLRH